MAGRSSHRHALAGVLIASGGCAPTPPPPAAPAPLPPLVVSEIAPAVSTPAPYSPAPHRDPLADLPPGKPVTLTASAVDVRALLPALAEAAGVSVVLGPEIQGRLSVNLVEVPAREALEAVLDEVGLSLATGPVAPAWGPVVFYALPVDVEEASVETIMERYGVSRAVAEWVVANRIPR